MNLVRKMLLTDLFKGLKVTFRNQHPKEIYTEQYPLQRPQIAERFRGAPRLNVNPETDESLCIACICVRSPVLRTLLLWAVNATRRRAARSSPTSPTT